MGEAVIVSIVLGGFGLLITLFYNQRSSKLALHKMQNDLFTEFNSRYNNINDGLNIIRTMSSSAFELFPIEEQKEMKNCIYDFFNLCAEEYYWKIEGRIPPKVWVSWERGMNDIYNESESIRKSLGRRM